MSDQPASTPQPPQRIPDARPRLAGAAAWRFVLICAFAGPLLGYAILAFLLALAQLLSDPMGALRTPLAALFGILYFGFGIALAYAAGFAPAAAAALLCLWWFNRHGILSRGFVAAAGFLAGLASVAIILWVTESWRGLGAPAIEGVVFFASVIVTSILCSLIIAPRALRRARR